MSLPTGTVTFLFTDIEGSTKLWEEQPEAMSAALLRHDALLRTAIESQDGVVFKTMGDGFCTAFATAPQALDAALSAQQALQSEGWPPEASLRVRMALHTGTAEVRDGDYFGQPLNRVSRLLSAGYGGQTLLSQTTYELLRDSLPMECSLEDLGSHSLRDLARPEQIYQLLHPALFHDFPSLKSLDYLPNNLPQQMTSFIGRERELAQVKDLLGKSRLLTLTGSGGAGKTRLALQTAADVLDNYPDGVWLIELAPITDPGFVLQSITNVLDLSEQPGQTLAQALTDWLKTKKLLLILDNCEHLLSASASIVDLLLRSCPHVHILASSREGLGITGELTYRVPSLSLPEAKSTQTADSLSHYEAVQLFIERALFHKSEFTVTNTNAPALASICLRLDGIPLALELAAARMRSLSVEEVNDRLDNRFRLLTGGSRTALPRQQTLRALIDWSYDLLTEPERSLLCRLAVFVGGWTLEAAEAVCIGEDIEEWEILDLLTSLVDKSLVITEEEHAQTRYRLLETVRQYGRDKLGESGESEFVRDKHAAYFFAMAEDSSTQLGSEEQSLWFERLETEHDNLRSALAWFVELPEGRGAMAGLRLGEVLPRFWLVRGHLSEGRKHLHAILTAPGAQGWTIERARALIGAGTLSQTLGDNEQAILLYEEGLAIARAVGDKLVISDAVGRLGTIARNQGDPDRARLLGEESLALARELENKPAIALALADLGMIAATQRDYSLARTLIEECLGIYREVGHIRAIAHFSNILGSLISDQGDFRQGRVLMEESLAAHRELGYKIGIAAVLANLGYDTLREGDYSSAHTFLGESLTIERELGNKSGIGDTLLSLGRLAFVQSNYDQATRLYEESLTIQRELGHKVGIGEALGNLGLISARQGDYVRGGALIDEALSLYRDLYNTNGIVESLLDLAHLALDQHHMTQAHSQLKEAWEILTSTEEHKPEEHKLIARALECSGRLFGVVGQEVRAAHLWGAAEAMRDTPLFARSPLDQPTYDRAIAEVRENLADDVFASAWAEGRVLNWQQAVEYALLTSQIKDSIPEEEKINADV